jgi:hypothetical protein
MWQRGKVAKWQEKKRKKDRTIFNALSQTKKTQTFYQLKYKQTISTMGKSSYDAVWYCPMMCVAFPLTFINIAWIIVRWML